ncbi:8221_t:CDS:2, partial [Cetraspora pellucida]
KKNETIDGNLLDLIPNNFGDIMPLRETSTLLPNEFSDLERICLTANGNLQRILSSWFNKPVKVQIIKNDNVPIHYQKLSTNVNAILQKFDREVNLICESKIICNAVSEVLIYDKEIVDLVMNKGISWQITLLSIAFEYTLKSVEVECKIKETFPNGMFENGWIEIKPTNFNNEKDNFSNNVQGSNNDSK